jgi:5-methylcytosine-specific restriction protein A
VFKFITSFFAKKEEYFGKRSSDWKKVRDSFVKSHPFCSACGTKNKLEVHHIRPYHVSPELELDKKNLITLCRNCHYIFGHYCDWQSWNINVKADTDYYNNQRLNRPSLNKFD